VSQTIIEVEAKSPDDGINGDRTQATLPIAERGPAAHSYQKITLVGIGILNQHGLRRRPAPVGEARNRLGEIVHLSGLSCSRTGRARVAGPFSGSSSRTAFTQPSAEHNCPLDTCPPRPTASRVRRDLERMCVFGQDRSTKRDAERAEGQSALGCVPSCWRRCR